MRTPISNYYSQVVKYKNCIFYDMGHGGLHPTTGLYMTPPRNGKFFNHGDKAYFHKDGIFYEGEKNRYYGYEVVKRLQEKGVNVIVVNHPFNDTSLQHRTDLANMYHANIQPGFYFSEHSNAANGRARGISLWTSIGQTTSDRLATQYMNIMKESLKPKPGQETPSFSLRFMEQMQDGDVDYEQNFHVLVRTVMPAVLSENLFFDNLQDSLLLFNNEYREWYVNAQVEFLEDVAKNL